MVLVKFMLRDYMPLAKININVTSAKDKAIYLVMVFHVRKLSTRTTLSFS